MFHLGRTSGVLRPSVLFPLLLSFACNRKADDSAVQSKEPPEHSSNKEASSKRITESAPESIATSEEIGQAVLTWVSAQNKGDFTAYQALYASKFTGVKRSGEREAQFDREGWLKDRGKMFEKPFTVEAKGLSISAPPHIAVVTFDQTWQSDTFRDRGAKRLIFVREGGRLLISREEMLKSETGAPGAITNVSFEQAALATKTLDSFALLIPGKIQASWAVDHPRFISNERAQRGVSVSALPETLKRHMDVRYEVFDKNGTRCEAKPRGFQLLVHIVPHFGTVNFWEGRMQSEGETPVVVPKEERALSLWRTGTGPFETDTTSPGIWLALEMETLQSCPDPVWGRAIREHAPAPWPVSAVDGEQMKELKASVSRHPSVLRFDQEARQEGTVPSQGRWFQRIEPGTARALQGPPGSTFFYATAVGAGGCASATPVSVGLLFRKQGDRLVPIEKPLYPDGQINAAVDLDGDGQAELISELSILRLGPGGPARVLDLSPLSLDCPC